MLWIRVQGLEEKAGVLDGNGVVGGSWWLPLTSHIPTKEEGNWPREADSCRAAVEAAGPHVCDLKGPTYAAESRLVVVEVTALASSVGSWSLWYQVLMLLE